MRRCSRGRGAGRRAGHEARTPGRHAIALTHQYSSARCKAVGPQGVQPGRPWAHLKPEGGCVLRGHGERRVRLQALLHQPVHRGLVPPLQLALLREEHVCSTGGRGEHRTHVPRGVAVPCSTTQTPTLARCAQKGVPGTVPGSRRGRRCRPCSWSRPSPRASCFVGRHFRGSSGAVQVQEFGEVCEKQSHEGVSSRCTSTAVGHAAPAAQLQKPTGDRTRWRGWSRGGSAPPPAALLDTQ